MDLKNFKDATALIGKNVKFEATCTLFPKQGIAGRVIRIEYGKNGELLYIVKTPKRGLEFSVGCNTGGLKVTVR